MKFYNREKELDLLKQIQKRSEKNAQMTFMVGRRRIGKTTLLVKAYEKENFLYFFVAKKNEALLCEEFVEEIKEKLQVEIHGSLKNFKDVFGFLMSLSKKRAFTLVIDEFQEFYNANKATYSDIQRLWDKNKNQSKINLVFCGSLYSMMKRIFEDAKEPLFGRATQRIQLNAFPVEALKQIISDFQPNFQSQDLLAFYTFTGGVPKYVELLSQSSDLIYQSMLDAVFAEHSLFLDEGKNVLIDEFGKEYGNYFSILSLIASSKTSRPEIESILEMQTGGYLKRLEEDFNIISKVRPIFAKPSSRVVKYAIVDNFLNFWFRFIYKNKSAVEMGNLEYVKKGFEQDFSTYSGRILERYFIEKLKAEKKYSIIGTYWEKKNQNEIDIVAVNELEKKIDFFEVKRQKKNINLSQLETKAEKLINQHKDYQPNFFALSMEDM